MSCSDCKYIKDTDDGKYYCALDPFLTNVSDTKDCFGCKFFEKREIENKCCGDCVFFDNRRCYHIDYALVLNDKIIPAALFKSYGRKTGVYFDPAHPACDKFRTEL